MEASAAPSAPASAAIEPPPGAGVSRETSSVNSFTVICTRPRRIAGQANHLALDVERRDVGQPHRERAAWSTSGIGMKGDLPWAVR